MTLIIVKGNTMNLLWVLDATAKHVAESCPPDNNTIAVIIKSLL